FGPLKDLIGDWTGDQGTDLAPEPDGAETNPYFETISYSAVGTATNAETQTLSVVHYRQIVRRKSDGNVFHDETGYWMWDPATATVMHSLVIPRAVGLLAGGIYQGETDDEGRTVIEVEAGIDNANWGIIQSPFMQKNARTTGFKQRVTVGNGKLSYFETTILDIYGKTFEHTDQNDLVRQ
ncbi:MAG: heme-binding beta-barrel domain-containing protein, partial [Proteobacteria bacterium]|nr:heme-binding beta-barrel domain-containing protein [Pseudomonadota bacterium]